MATGDIDPLSATAASSRTGHADVGASPDSDTLPASSAAPDGVTPPPGYEGVKGRRLRSQVKAALFGDGPDAARIGRFRVLRKLGEGGMGVVYAARDDELDRTVAIKLLRSDRDGDVARLQREARAMARLSHPNVAAVYDVGAHEGDVYVAMELVEGDSLRDWARSPRSWSEIRDVVLQAAAGLQAAHDVGIVHRDFKPDNVMVGRDGRVRVLDFGLAKAADIADDESRATASDGPVSLTQTGAVMGTPRYMAPEQFRGDEVGPATDVFALCVTIYELCYRARPFDGESVLELAGAVLTADAHIPVAPEGVPEGLWPILRGGLAANASRRPPSVAQLSEALSGLGDEGGPATSPVPRAPRWTLTVGIVTIALAAGGGGLLATRGSTPLPVALELGVPATDDAASVPKEDIQQVIAGARAEQRACFTAARDRIDGVHGRVAVDFAIGTDGKARSVVANSVALFDRDGQPVDDAELSVCYRRVIEGLTFPAPASGSVQVSYPFVLVPLPPK
jgi:predicted Ser/Thr protein kinase